MVPEPRLIALLQDLRGKGREDIVGLLAKCRFLRSESGLEIGGSREFYRVMSGEARAVVLEAVKNYLGVAENKVVFVYLPSALRQHMPDLREHLS